MLTKENRGVKRSQALGQTEPGVLAWWGSVISHRHSHPLALFTCREDSLGRALFFVSFEPYHL